MATFFSILFILIGAWLVWVPWREYRHAQATGQQRVSFSRMLMRMTVAGCVIGIGVLVFLGTREAPGRSALAAILFLSGAAILALVMFVAGMVDYYLAKRELLLGQKELIQEMLRRTQGDDRPAPPSSNGHDPSPS